MSEPRYSAEIVITYKRRRRPSQSGIKNAVVRPGSPSDIQSENAVVLPGSPSDFQSEHAVVRLDSSLHSDIENTVVCCGSSSNVQNGKHPTVPVDNSEAAPLILKDKNHNDTVVEPMAMQISEDSALLGSTPVLSKTLEKSPSDNDMAVEPMAIQVFEEPSFLGLTLLSETIEKALFLDEMIVNTSSVVNESATALANADEMITADPMKHIVVLSSDDELPAAVKAKRRTPASASGSRKKSKTSRKGKKRARDGAAHNGASGSRKKRQSKANNLIALDNVIIIDSDSDAS